MPLFGSSHKHQNTHAARDEQLTNNNNNAAGLTGRHNATGAGATGTGMGHHNGGYGATGAGTGVGGQGLNDPNYPNQNLGGHGHAGGISQQSNALPPAGTLNDADQGRGGHGHSMGGKVEHAMGSLIGSNALKAKGMQKEQEANSIKLQSSELAEAERLEREALMRRERAVAHGAHPGNKALGGSGANSQNSGGY